MTLYYVTKVLSKYDTQFEVLSTLHADVEKRLRNLSEANLETMKLILIRFIIEQVVQRNRYFDRAIEEINSRFPDLSKNCKESVYFAKIYV